MKTVHLTNSWHETSGGVATFYRALMREANLRGHMIRLIVPGESDRIQEAGQFGKIYHIEAPPSPFNPNYRTIYPTQFLPPGSKVQQILASERPDLVEICDKYTLHYLAAVLRADLLHLDFRPVVVGLSCERMDDNFQTYIGRIPFSRKFCSAYMKWLYFPFFDHHIANSTYTADELRTAAEDQSSSRGTWIRHMGVDLSYFSSTRRNRAVRRQLLEKFGAAEEAVLLLYVGRLVPEKNLPLLFDLLAHLTAQDNRDFRLLIAGDGLERAHWEKVSSERTPGRVVFLGHVKESNALARLYANADVFVHPNPREPFGIAPLEAMASALPLLAPDSGGVTSYADTENAWVVPPRVETFAAAINEIIENEPLRHQKIEKALETAQQYSWESIASSFLDLYAQMYQAADSQKQILAAPAFRSIPAHGMQATLFRGVSRTAQKTFVIATKFARG